MPMTLVKDLHGSMERWSISMPIITTVLGGFTWLVQMHGNLEGLEEQTKSMQMELTEQRRAMQAQEQRLSRIEGMLQYITEAVSKYHGKDFHE